MIRGPPVRDLIPGEKIKRHPLRNHAIPNTICELATNGDCNDNCQENWFSGGRRQAAVSGLTELSLCQ